MSLVLYMYCILSSCTSIIRVFQIHVYWYSGNNMRVVEITMHVFIYVFGMCLNIAILTVTI